VERHFFKERMWEMNENVCGRKVIRRMRTVAVVAESFLTRLFICVKMLYKETLALQHLKETS